MARVASRSVHVLLQKAPHLREPLNTSGPPNMARKPSCFSLLIRFHPLQSSSSALSPASILPCRVPFFRTFATHRDHPTTSSTSHLDPRASLGASTMDGRERVGPFPLGVGPSGRNKTWKTWRELGLGGKCGFFSTPGLAFD